MVSHDHKDIDNTLLANHYTVVLSDTSILNVGKVDNKLDIKIFEFDIDVSSNYNINYLYGTLEISPLSITIKPQDLEITYSDTLINHSEAEFLEGGLISGQKIVIETLGTSSEHVGVYDNEIINYQILDNEVDVTANYEVTTNLGIITIHKKNLVLRPIYNSKIYDGLEFISNQLEFFRGYTNY